MIEAVIYLTRVSTRDIRESGGELLDWDMRVIDRFIEAILDPQFPFIPFTTDRAYFLIHPDRLANNVRRGWRRSSASFKRVLGQANLLHNPGITDMKIGEMLATIPFFANTDEITSYLNGLRQRIGYLASPEGRYSLDSLKWGGFAYVENRILERAAEDKVYFKKPGPTFHFSTS